MCIAGGEICFATMDGSGAHEESIMARNLRSETEEILNENIDKSYGFTCIIGYLVFYDFDVFRMPDGFRYSFRRSYFCTMRICMDRENRWKMCLKQGLNAPERPCIRIG